MKPTTTGPWKATRSGKAKKYIYAGDQRIATVHHFFTGSSDTGHNPSHATGNATLIAAAPDLLEACETMLRLERQAYAIGIQPSETRHEAIEEMRRAVAKARSEQYCKAQSIYHAKS